MAQIIDKTDRYSFNRLTLGRNERRIYINPPSLQTVFLHKGSANVRLWNLDGRLSKEEIGEGEGFITLPGINFSLTTTGSFLEAFQVVSDVEKGDLVFETIDHGDGREKRLLDNYKVIKNPTRVTKPWGDELWISWLDRHVLKRIRMNEGEMSSLQLHREKLETNYLAEGEADVIDGYPVDLSLTEKEMKESVRDVDWKRYTERKMPGMHWTSKPGIVHRVIAKTGYVAFEASTPQLLDVVRLSDKGGRKSGRIDSEHE